MNIQSNDDRDFNPGEYKKQGREKASNSERPWLLFSSLPYYTLPFVYYGYYISLKYYNNPFFFAWLIYGLVPLVEYYTKHDWLNPTKEQYKELEKSIAFKIPLYVGLFTNWIFTFWSIKYLCMSEFNVIHITATIFGVGSLAAANFSIAHELFHKNATLPRIFGILAMAPNLYMHFFIEHNYGHHKRVATPSDPASSLAGETYYKYLPRSIIGSYKSAWEYESNKLVNIKGFKSAWVPQNRMIWFALNNIIFPLIVQRIFGWYGLLVFLMIVMQSISYLEGINYIEHYGLQRKEISPGVYEKVNIKHSWNAPHRLTNFLLFKIQRHSDHHENAYKHYQTLLTVEGSPMLPCGYSLGIMMGFFPPVWFEVMNPILQAYKEERSLDEKEIKKCDYALRKFIWLWFGAFLSFVIIWGNKKNL